VGSIRKVWNHFWLWVDWHGRMATLVMLIVSFGGAWLVHWGLTIWSNVPAQGLWIISILLFAVFLCTLSLVGSKLQPRPEGDIGEAVDARTKREIYEINCEYLPISPLERGWRVGYQDSDAKPEFRAPEEPGIGGLALVVDQKYKIVHDVPREHASLANELVLAIQYGKGAMFWIEVNVTSRDGFSQRDCHIIKILVGDSPPRDVKEYPKEHLVWVVPDPLPNGWVNLRLRLPEIVAKALGSRGYVYESVKSIQLRGCISVSPIKFLSSQMALSRHSTVQADLERGRND
jgi:hypothetical protein